MAHAAPHSDGLGRVPGQAGVGAEHVRGLRRTGGVARPSGQHDLGAVAQRLFDRLDAHHGDDVAGAQGLLVDLGCAVQRLDQAVLWRHTRSAGSWSA